MIMAVMVRETWTDERLDDLSKKVDDGFADVKTEMREGFAKVDRRFSETKAETTERFDRLETRVEKDFGELNQRFDRMQFTLIGSAAGIIAALIGIIATQL
jgi:tetrahydromethanopterin S-methyltransferase subunit G